MAIRLDPIFSNNSNKKSRSSLTALEFQVFGTCHSLAERVSSTVLDLLVIEGAFAGRRLRWTSASVLIDRNGLCCLSSRKSPSGFRNNGTIDVSVMSAMMTGYFGS